MHELFIFTLEKINAILFSFLSQIFPCFPSLFHAFIDTMILSFKQSFQYHRFTDNMGVLKFLQ